MTDTNRFHYGVGAILYLIRRREFVLALLVGFGLGFLSLLTIKLMAGYGGASSGWISDLQSEYLIWVAEQYALSGDLESAREKLGVEHGEVDKIARILEQTALEQNDEEAIKLLVLAMTLKTSSESVLDERTLPSTRGSFTWVVMIGMLVMILAGLAGGGLLIFKGLNYDRAGSSTERLDTRNTAVAPSASPANGTRGKLGSSYWERSWVGFLSSWSNLLALGIIGIFLFVAIAAPWLAPQEDPENPSYFHVAEIDGHTAATRSIPLPPGPGIPLGTAPRGLDIYYSLVWGVRPALRFGLTVALVTAFIGILVGAISGYAGGRLNRLTLSVTDAFLAFPAIAGVFLFSLLISSTAPGEELTAIQNVLITLQIKPVILALIIFSWMPYTRIINSSMTTLKGSEYACAATTIGAGHPRIIFRHLLPNAIAPAIVLLARDIGAMVVLEAAFTFIGVTEGLPWSVLLVNGRNWIIGPGGSPLNYWWTFIPVTLALILFGVGWNLLGDGLNVALNPRRKSRWAAK